MPQIIEKGISSASFRLLFSCLAVIGVGNSMLFAILPPIARQLGLPDWTVSAIFSLSALLWVITSPIWGRVSDKAGRKPIIVIGLSAYSISTILFTLTCAFALMFRWDWGLAVLALALSRAIFGSMGSATNPAAQAYIADATPIESRTKEIAAITSAYSFGNAAGPALAAALIVGFGLLSPLIVVSFVSIIGAIALHLYLPKTTIMADTEKPKEINIWKLARAPHVRPWLIFGVTLSAVTAVLFQQISFYYIDTLGVSAKEGASLVAISLASGALAQIVAQIGLIPRLKMTPRGLLVFGSIVCALGTALTVFGGNHGTLNVAQIFLGLGFGLARPGFTGGASMAVGKEEQGTIAGLVVASNGAGFIIAPIFGAGLYALISPQAPFILCTIVLLALAIYGRLHPKLGATELEEAPLDNSNP